MEHRPPDFFLLLISLLSGQSVHLRQIGRVVLYLCVTVRTRGEKRRINSHQLDDDDDDDDGDEG